ncbi:MAG: universal stress protein [Pseudonocardia sp.]|nr:universal stress protein [Pseudonocardia sp.]
MTAAAAEPGGAETSAERPIVVGVDGSECSHSALRWAVDQARVTGARVAAIAVWAPPTPMGAGAELGAGGLLTGGPAVAGLVPAPQVDRELEAQADRLLDAAVAELPADGAHRVDRHVLLGDPATVLLEAAEAAELLVLGNAGHGALAGAITGSVALSCVHHAPCPVVLVPARPSPADSDRRAGTQ